jgi:hypothetical protein
MCLIGYLERSKINYQIGQFDANYLKNQLSQIDFIKVFCLISNEIRPPRNLQIKIYFKLFGAKLFKIVYGF